MALDAPVVSPLGKDGKLQTTANVVASQGYADPSPTDQLQLTWGNFASRSGSPDPDHPADPVRFPISSNMVCDGSATVWSSIEDRAGNIAYSATYTVAIDQSGNTLGAAALAAADKRNPAQGMTVTFTGKPTNVVFSLGMLDAATITWTIYSEDGTPAPGNTADNPHKKVIPILNDGGFSKPGNVPTYTTTVMPAPVGAQYAVLVYSVIQAHAPQTDADGTTLPQSSQTFVSAPVRAAGNDLFGPDTDVLPAPVYTDAVNGILDLDQVAGDIRITIPQTPLIDQDYAVFTGNGKDADAVDVPEARWLNNNEFNVRTTPYDGATIPRGFVNAVPDGGTYTISYTSRKTNLTSPSATVTIRKGGKPPPDTEVGNLFGWGNGTNGVLG